MAINTIKDWWSAKPAEDKEELVLPAYGYTTLPPTPSYTCTAVTATGRFSSGPTTRDIDALCTSVCTPMGVFYKIDYDMHSGGWQIRLTDKSPAVVRDVYFRQTDRISDMHTLLIKATQELVDHAALTVHTPKTPGYALSPEECARVRRMLAAFEGAIKEKATDDGPNP